MAKEIKRRIVLEGEKEYNAALKEVGRNLKTLKSELKAETAELGANATQQQKNEVKMKSLQKQIKEQEKAVKTYQEALAEVKEKYSDNEDAIAKWETKLNDARATLANMRNSLEEVSQGVAGTTDTFKQAASSAAETVTATKNVADAMGELSDIGEGVSSAIENIFTGMLDTVLDIAEKMWSLISKTAEKANGWTDTANIWGTDAQTIQQYTRAMEAQGKSFEDLESIVTKIVYGGKGKKITELLGISGVNYRGYNDWDYAMVVMNKIYEMQQRGKNMNSIYEEIFGGKNASKVIDIVNSWEDIQKSLGTFNGNETAYGLNDEELEKMNQLWVQINTIETKFDALKDKFAAGLGIATGTLLVNVEGGLDALEKFMSAETPEEREAALEELRKNVEDFFTKVGDILREGIKILGEVGQELQESDDPVVRAIGDILTALRDALDWIVNNQDKVLLAFEVIFGTALMGHLASAAGKLTEIIAMIKVVEKFKGLGGAAAAAGGAASAAGGAAAAGAGGKLVSTALGGGSILGGLLSAGAGLLAGWPLYEKFKEVGWQGIIEAMFPKEKMPGVPTGVVDSYKETLSHTDAERKQAIDYGLGLLLGKGEEKQKEEPEQQQQPSSAGPKRKKNITGTATEESMQGTAPEVKDAAEEIAEAVEKAINEPTRGQKAAAEAFWDAYREGTYTDAQMEALESAFTGQDELLEKLINLIDELSPGGWENQDWRNTEDLPANWWLDAERWQNAGNANNGNAITSSDLQNFRSLPASLFGAVRQGAAEGISNIRVLLDGRAVGYLVADYVSEYIAQDITG